MSFFGWRLDSDGHSLWSPDNEQIRLTGREFQILHALVERRGRILSRDQILDIIADRHWTPYDRSIDVMIAKIRRKLHDDARDTRFIKTIRGIGYMFASQTTQPQSRGY
jgi:DNA-binding response OmpR family regulator